MPEFSAAVDRQAGRAECKQRKSWEAPSDGTAPARRMQRCCAKRQQVVC